jgi:DNA polymerase III epsilon subunit-like protein
VSTLPAVAILDAETTGLHTEAGHEAWEWGLILRRPGEQDTEFLWQVRPDLAHADPEALRKGGYYQRALLHNAEPGAACLVEGPESAKVSTARELAQVIAPLIDGAILVGCNPGFDKEFLRPFLRRHGQAYTCHYRPVCVTTFAAGFMFGKAAGYTTGWNELAREVRLTRGGYPDLPLNPRIFEDGARLSHEPLPELPWSSNKVAASVGVDPAKFDRHTALADCRFAAAQLDAVMGDAQ